MDQEIRPEDIMPPPGAAVGAAPPTATPPPRKIMTNETMAAFMTRLREAIADPSKDEELANAALELTDWESVSSEGSGLLANMSPEFRFRLC